MGGGDAWGGGVVGGKWGQLYLNNKKRKRKKNKIKSCMQENRMTRSAYSTKFSLSSLSLFDWQRWRKMNVLHIAEKALKWKFFENVTKRMELYMLARKNFGNMYSEP